RIVLRESEHHRPLEPRSHGFERRAGERLACQRVLDHTHVHALATRLGTQLGHLSDRQPAVLGGHDRLGLRRNLGHFRYQRLLAFQVKCHSSLLSLRRSLTSEAAHPYAVPATVTSTPRGASSMRK